MEKKKLLYVVLEKSLPCAVIAHSKYPPLYVKSTWDFTKNNWGQENVLDQCLKKCLCVCQCLESSWFFLASTLCKACEHIFNSGKMCQEKMRLCNEFSLVTGVYRVKYLYMLTNWFEEGTRSECTRMVTCTCLCMCLRSCLAVQLSVHVHCAWPAALHAVQESIIKHFKIGPLMATCHDPVWYVGLGVSRFVACLYQSNYQFSYYYI